MCSDIRNAGKGHAFKRGRSGRGRYAKKKQQNLSELQYRLDRGISFGFVCNYGQAENVQDDGTRQTLLVGIVFACGHDANPLSEYIRRGVLLVSALKARTTSVVLALFAIQCNGSLPQKR